MKKEIILLHGAIGASEQLEPLRQALAENFIAYSFDLPAHGKNGEIVENFSIPLFAGEVKNFIRQNSLDKPYIFGYSMGGYIALYLEAISPGTFKRIITFATKYHWNPEISQRESKLLNPEIIESKVPGFAADLMERHMATGWKNVLSKSSEMIIELGDNPLLNKDILEKINCNCLISVGDKDKMISLEETIDLYSLLRNAELMIMPGTQHSLEKVNMERLKFEIIEFCSNSD